MPADNGCRLADRPVIKHGGSLRHKLPEPLDHRIAANLGQQFQVVIRKRSEIRLGYTLIRFGDMERTVSTKTDPGQ